MTRAPLPDDTQAQGARLIAWLRANGRTSCPALGLACDAETAEGTAYARALLDRIKAGGSTPGELADLVQFLASGSLLHAACVVIFAAIRATTTATTGRASDDPRPGT